MYTSKKQSMLYSSYHCGITSLGTCVITTQLRALINIKSDVAIMLTNIINIAGQTYRYRINSNYKREVFGYQLSTNLAIQRVIKVGGSFSRQNGKVKIAKDQHSIYNHLVN